MCVTAYKSSFKDCFRQNILVFEGFKNYKMFNVLVR